MTSRLEELIERSAEGDRAALSELCRRLQGPIYRLAIDMLWHPADAEDAAQEILMKVVTHLGSFEGRSAASTWVYRIAFRHLLRVRASRVERAAHETTAADFAATIDAGLGKPSRGIADAELRVLTREVRIGCVAGMLQCLSRIERAAFILADVLGVKDAVGAEICEVSSATYRQRVSRARQKIETILRGRCGLVSETNPCSCGHQARAKSAEGLTPAATLFRCGERTARAFIELRALGRAAAWFRADPVEPREQLWTRLRAACPDLLG